MRKFSPQIPNLEIAHEIAEIYYPAVIGVEDEIGDSHTLNLLDTIQPYQNFYETRLGRVVAFGSLNIGFINTGLVGLEIVCVRQDSRNKGLGATFVRELEEEARQFGAQAMVVDSLADSAGFYKAIGYEQLARDGLRFGKSL